jgi:hypothetical protein
MGDFFRSKYGLDNEQGFVQGAGRVLIADYEGSDHPDGFEDLLVLTAGATQYDAMRRGLMSASRRPASTSRATTPRRTSTWIR